MEIELFKDERIILLCRRHWLTFFFAAFNVLILMMAVIGAPFFLAVLIPERLVSIISVYEGLMFLAVVLAVEMLWVVLFLIFIDYYLDVWIVTDHRLIFVELHGIFSRTVSSVHLRNIQDISTDIHGIIPTLLGFGNIRAESAATQGEFIFKQVPNPNAIKDIILKAKEEFLVKESAGAHKD